MSVAPAEPVDPAGRAKLERAAPFHVADLASGFARLFFTRKFLSHRVIGLAFLVQFISATILYLTDYERFLHSPLIWTLPLNGVIQSANAALTFTCTFPSVLCTQRSQRCKRPTL